MQIITYTDPSSHIDIPDVVYLDDTIWMTQEQIGTLYNKASSGISQHISNIYRDGELSMASTSTDDRIFRNPENTEEKTKNTLKKPKKYYNLQMIIAVGFKVNSPQATAFRTWANGIIDEYSRTWYALDDNRLKWEKTIFSDKRDYDGLMERVRAIRFDERNVYEKIKDLFTTAVDYNKSSQEAIEFFQTIQNKFHYAIVGMTSPEILLKRAGSNKAALGMIHHSKKNITVSEATVGKNYLLEDELHKLYLLCEQFFAFAELQYAYERDLFMQDWVQYLDELLRMNKLEILSGKWRVSRESVEEYVRKQIAEYQERWWSLEAYIEGAEYLLETPKK